jgi:SAM-dependent methyltransferase
VSGLIWHEVECGGYAADLPLWEELADGCAADARILELGCGAGRVTMHLARRREALVIGIDNDAELVAAIWEAATDTYGDAEIADVRGFEAITEFALALAPMQLIQLLADDQERRACLACVADSLLGGGRAAFAIVEEMPAVVQGGAPLLPDVRQVEGWIYSSLPLEPHAGPESIVLRRLRQTVAPDGAMSDELNEVELALLSAEQLEQEGTDVGLVPAGRRQIPATEAHVGSTVVLFEKAP